LKDSWSNAEPQLPDINPKAEEYLEKVKENLKVSAQIAKENAEMAQTIYTDNYNTCTKDKSFSVGDEVLVLHPSSTNSLKSQWQGPAMITAVIPPNSYRVSLSNGAIRTLHANDLRSYVARVQSVGVVFEGDDLEFGNIEVCPSDHERFEDVISKVDMSHLSKVQQREMSALLQKYNDIFSDKAGACNVTEHEINLIEGAVPKRQRPYRIPEKQSRG
jgi:hypothetical protein